MKVLAIIKSNLLQLGMQSLTMTPMCCASGHALNLSQCYQMVGSGGVIEHSRVASHLNKKPIKNKRINQRRVRFSLDEKSTSSTFLLKLKDSHNGTTTTSAASSFQKNKHKSGKSSASIVFVSFVVVVSSYYLHVYKLT